jgi:hypothetical protein
MGRPVLFLDVDGVLNPFGPVCPPGFAEHDLFPGEEPVRVNPEHGTLAWSQARQAPTRLITTEPAVGLTRAHVRQALEWARGLG